MIALEISDFPLIAQAFEKRNIPVQPSSVWFAGYDIDGQLNKLAVIESNVTWKHFLIKKQYARMTLSSQKYLYEKRYEECKEIHPLYDEFGKLLAAS